MIKMQIDSKELEKLKENITGELFDKAFIATSNEIAEGAFKKAITQIKKKWNHIRKINMEQALIKHTPSFVKYAMTDAVVFISIREKKLKVRILF